MPSTPTMNGIDLEAVRRVTDRYRREPGSRPRFAARVDWIGGYRTESRLGPAQVVRGDEPEELAGTGTGPSPEDMLLGAVGQCLIVGLAGASTARGVEIRALAVEVEGDVNLPAAYGVADGSPGFEHVRITVHLDSPADRLELDALLTYALERAPIPNTISRPVRVSATLA
jgi:uncharacterized OsmC-like protein